MLSVNGLFDLIKQFINGNGLYALILLFGFLYIYRANKKEQKVIIGALMLLVILVFNPLSYYIIGVKLNHTAPYYRFMWVIPYGLILAYGVGETLKDMNRKAKILLASILCVSVIVICVPAEKLALPENVYQIPAETISVAEQLETLRVANNQEEVWVLTDGEICNTIRQYNARICYPMSTYHIAGIDPTLNEETVEGLCSMIMYNRSDISGDAIQEIVAENQLDYLVIRVENMDSITYLQELGWGIVGSTEKYCIMQYWGV